MYSLMCPYMVKNHTYSKKTQNKILIILISIFCIGYAAIIFENIIGINKSATAILTGVLSWSVYSFYISPNPEHTSEQLNHHISEIAGIVFFLLGAMTIVEIIDVHEGFDIITENIKTRRKIILLWLIGILTFFLSPLLDNLTTTIVMVSILQKIIPDKKDRWLLTGIVIIAANAGGAWSPIGDVTTSMLWIGEQISATAIVKNIFLPSFICMLVPLVGLSFQMKGHFELKKNEKVFIRNTTRSERNFIFFMGIFGLLCVPIFKTLTHLPPFMGMLMSLSVIWLITEIIHRGKTDVDKEQLSVLNALRKIDMPSILFFVGILLSVAALSSSGVLMSLANSLTGFIKNDRIIVFAAGIFSAIVDNVPLVAAFQGMYTLQQFPTDHPFWLFLAYTTGTGGSLLIIGSAAGVVAMGMENISFGWYLKKIGIWALLGFLCGGLVSYLLF